MNKKRILFILSLLAVVLVIFACTKGTTKKDAADRTDKKAAKKTEIPEKPVRKDSPLHKVTPDFTGFDWKSPRKIKDFDFSQERVYFLMLDRFSDGNKDNNYHVDKGNLKAWNGGDLAGATKRLKHIKDMGFSAIWISPIVDNDEPPAGGQWWFYHGYHFKDPYTVDEHFGSNADFIKFVEEAHKLGIKVLLDVVVNHSGHTFMYRPDRNEKFKDWFNPAGVKHTDNPVKGWILGAPDFDQSNPHASAFLMDYVKFWISKAKIDGLRLDTVKHVDDAFWPKFSKNMKDFAGPGFFLMGEVYDWQASACIPYMKMGLDSLVDFPLYPKMNHVFGKDGSMNALSGHLQGDEKWPDANSLGTFIDNHDVARFLQIAGKNGKDMLKAGLAFIYTIRGFPVVYYGTEVNMKGKGASGDDGRLMMPWKEVDAGKHDAMIDYISKLNKIRGASKALQQGGHTEIYKDYSVYAYIRSIDGEAALAIINKIPEKSEYTFTLPADANFTGTIKDLLSGKKFSVKDNKLTMALEPRTSYIFKAEGGKKLEPAWVKFSDRMPKGIGMATFKIKKPDANQVFLAGDFNGWDQKASPMKKQEDGTFILKLPLKPGEYKYKFIVDGEWVKDPNEDKNAGPPYNNSVKVVK